jgi:hypothetical protein
MIDTHASRGLAFSSVSIQRHDDSRNIVYLADHGRAQQAMHTHKELESLSIAELRALEERIARGETTFDEEMELIIANGGRPDEAAFEAALERALCRGEDPPRTLEDELADGLDTDG